MRGGLLLLSPADRALEHSLIHALIEIAHPNFRDQLTEQAKDLRLW